MYNSLPQANQWPPRGETCTAAGTIDSFRRVNSQGRKREGILCSAGSAAVVAMGELEQQTLDAVMGRITRNVMGQGSVEVGMLSTIKVGGVL